MAVQGVFTSDAGVQGGRNGGFADGVLQIHPTGSAQLFALSSGMESMDWNDTIVTWFEETKLTGRIQATNSPGTSGTTLTVDDGSEIVAGSIIWHENSGEYIAVEAVAGNSLTIQRGIGGSSAGNIAANDYLQLITNAQEEGSDKPTSVANVASPRYNYMQTVRNSWDVTRSAKQVQYRTGDLKARNRAECGVLHAEAIEKAMIWGIRSIGVRNGKVYHTMNGVKNQLSSNVQVQAAATPITWDDIDSFLLNVFAKNIKGKPNERIVFCGNTVVKAFNQVAKANGTINLEPGTTEQGLKVIKWFTPYGDISLITHPLFNESPVFTKDLLIMHPGAFRTRYLSRTFEDAYDKDGTRAGRDADFGVLTTELTCEYRAEMTGGYWSGIESGA